MKKSYTLLEIVIVIGLLAAIGVAAFVLLNPKAQFDKALDQRRKADLALLKKVFEDWYNDKNCYPKPSEVCYNPQVSAVTCNICGKQSTPNAMKSYIQELPCDPEFSRKDYLYEVDSVSCPSWYRIYSSLNYKGDQDSSLLGCVFGGCGLRPLYGYDYGISSSNIDLGRATNYYCVNQDNDCNVCGSYDTCKSSPQCRAVFGNQSSCCAFPGVGCAKFYCVMSATNSCETCGFANECDAKVASGVCSSIRYGRKSDCCSRNPGAGGC